MNQENIAAEPAKRRCRLCEMLGFSVEEYTQEAIERLLRMHPEQACAKEQFAERIRMCDACKHQDKAGICMMCGCYCTVRACLTTQKCPLRKW